MRTNIVEAIVGALVLGIAGFFFIFAYYKGSGILYSSPAFYSANFDRLDGVNVGSDVKISGVKVGTVQKITIDPESFLANLVFEVDASLKIPTDSSAEIVSEGLMGNKYLALVPGGSQTYLKAGDTIEYTQSSISLESMIGQLIFTQKDKKNEQNNHS